MQYQYLCDVVVTDEHVLQLEVSVDNRRMFGVKIVHAAHYS